MQLSIDIELTNRCNAKCHFCPRDQTPHQGLMTPEVFDQSLARVIEFRDAVDGSPFADPPIHLCGLGEPLLNKRAPEHVRQVREAGFHCSMASNGSLLDEERGRALLDAGLQRININVGERGDGYEDVYKLPWERTRDNVTRFIAMADGRCEVNIVLVNHRRDDEHMDEMRSFWRGFGIKQFSPFNVINRGGALFVDHMQFEKYPESASATQMLTERGGAEPICFLPFASLFVGYDGQYYLCCSDWKKEAPLGSVFDTSFIGVTRIKLDHVLSREPVCKTCNVDPVNRLTEIMRDVNAGDESEDLQEKALDQLADSSRATWDALDRYDEIAARDGVTMDAPNGGGRRRIPLTVE